MKKGNINCFPFSYLLSQGLYAQAHTALRPYKISRKKYLFFKRVGMREGDLAVREALKSSA